MPKVVYDTRFFVEHYYSRDEDTLNKTKNEIRKTKDRNVSSIVIHEVYRLTLQKEGHETAELRANLLTKDFKVIEVDAKIAIKSAEIRHKYNIPMADSIIAATSTLLDATCISDDPHFVKVKEIKTRWI